MDYRKVVNGKKKLIAAVDGIKNFAVDKSKEVKEYTGSTMDEFKYNIKNTAKDVKESISNTVQTKIENEFRKNFPSYAISFVDNYIITSFAKDVDKVVIMLVDNNKDKEGVLSIQSIFDEISDGMLSDSLMEKYRTKNIFNALFDYLSLYYSTEPNLDVEISSFAITISLPKETSEDVEEETKDVE